MQDPTDFFWRFLNLQSYIHIYIQSGYPWFSSSITPFCLIVIPLFVYHTFATRWKEKMKNRDRGCPLCSSSYGSVNYLLCNYIPFWCDIVLVKMFVECVRLHKESLFVSMELLRPATRTPLLKRRCQDHAPTTIPEYPSTSFYQHDLVRN